MAQPSIGNTQFQKISAGKTLSSFSVSAGQVLFAFISKGGNDTPTCTWNGGAMTSTLVNNTQGRHQTLFMLTSPTTGIHNVVFSTTQSFGTIACWTVNGCNATPIGQNNVTANGSSSPLTASITLTYNNSMVMICSFVDNVPTLTAGAGQTPIYSLADSGSQSGVASYIVPGSVGVNTLTYSFSGTNDWEPILFEIVATTPITPTVSSNGNFFLVL